MVRLTTFRVQQQQGALGKALCNGCTTKNAYIFARYFPERKNHARCLPEKLTILTSLEEGI
jgi:hypothetical protein